MALRLELGVEPIVPDQRRSGQANRDDQETEREPDPFVNLQPGRPQFLFLVVCQGLVAFAENPATARGCNLIANDYQQRNY